MIDQVTGLDADDEEHQELGVTVQQADGRQQAEDAAEAAVERNGGSAAPNVPLTRRWPAPPRRAQHADRVEPQQPVGVVKILKKSGQEPQRQQFEQGADRPVWMKL